VPGGQRSSAAPGSPDHLQHPAEALLARVIGAGAELATSGTAAAGT